MARDEAVRERTSEEAGQMHEQKSSKLLDRREYVKLAGAGIAALGGVGLGSSSAAAAEGGPSNPDNWNLAFEDTFEGGSLDTSKWEVGFGWGMDTTASAERISEKHVDVRDNALHLTASHESGEVLAGSVHTRGMHYWGPGSFWEAKIKVPKREGFLPAFWSKSNSGDWPPEIDFMESFQDGDADDVKYANYNVHYSDSTRPGDSSTHKAEPVHYKTDYDLSQDFHIFGCKWLTDRVEYFFDGVKVGQSDRATAMEALRKGAPFYMMLNIHIDKVGTTDKSEEWTEEMVVDWVRVWDQSSSDSSSSTETTQETTDTTDSTTQDSTTDSPTEDGSSTSTKGDHYLWARSADGSQATFRFQASDGNIHFDSSGNEADYWISADGKTAGGRVSATGSLPGFWYDGEITGFEFSGALETYRDDQQVSPGSLGSDSATVPNSITIDGDGSSDSTPYSFSVTGPVGGTLSSDQSVTGTERLNPDDAVSGNAATGNVVGGKDTYVFEGDLAELSLDGEADVYVNGKQADLLVVSRAPESSGGVMYMVESTGTIAQADVPAGSTNPYDSNAGPKAMGRVFDGTDAYWIADGEITDVSAYDGKIVTKLNGSEQNLHN